MKKWLTSQFRKLRRKPDAPQKVVATPEDIRKKLLNYQRTEGPANFGSAGLYHVNEVARDELPTKVRREREEDSVTE